jgi:hypothetical protein
MDETETGNRRDNSARTDWEAEERLRRGEAEEKQMKTEGELSEHCARG